MTQPSSEGGMFMLPNLSELHSWEMNHEMRAAHQQFIIRYGEREVLKAPDMRDIARNTEDLISVVEGDFHNQEWKTHIVGVGGPASSGKQTILGQQIAQIIDKLFPYYHEGHLDISVLTLDAALREQRNRGIISSAKPHGETDFMDYRLATYLGQAAIMDYLKPVWGKMGILFIVGVGGTGVNPQKYQDNIDEQYNYDHFGSIFQWLGRTQKSFRMQWIIGDEKVKDRGRRIRGESGDTSISTVLQLENVAIDREGEDIEKLTEFDTGPYRAIDRNARIYRHNIVNDPNLGYSEEDLDDPETRIVAEEAYVTNLSRDWGIEQFTIGKNLFLDQTKINFYQQLIERHAINLEHVLFTPR